MRSAILGRLRSTALGESVETRARFWTYERDRRARRRRYSQFATWESGAALADLRANGYAFLRRAADPTELALVKAQLDACCAEGLHLDPVSHDATRAAGDVAAAKSFLPPAVLAAGPDAYRNQTNQVSVADPLVHCPATVALAFSPILIGIAGAYFDCLPAVGNVNLRTSFVNDLADFDTQYFHSDPNSPRFLKFFFYLNDVDAEGGPFCYVRGSNREKHPGWRRKYRWTQDEIARIYGEDRIDLLLANVGDVIVADTTGFHRGTKAIARDRSMLTVDYVIHPEFGGRVARGRITADAVRALSPMQQAAADLLDLVDDGTG